MTKSATVRARIEPRLKENVDQILSELGLSQADLITMLYKQIEMNHALPFKVKITNKATSKAIKDAQNNRNLTSHGSVDALLASHGVKRHAKP